MVDRSTGRQVKTLKVIDVRHQSSGYKIFMEIVPFMRETGRQVDR